MIQGQYTLAQLTLSAGLSYRKILDCRIQSSVGEHGICEILLEVADTTESSRVNALKDSEAAVLLEGSPLLRGIITQAGVSRRNGYCQVRLVITSRSILADKKKESCVFQDPGKKLSDMVSHALSGTGLTAQYEKDTAIAHVVYRQNETAWQFIKRLAAQYQYNVYADLKSSTIAIGETGFAAYPETDLGQISSVNKDISELRRVQNNQDSTAAAYAYESQEYLSANPFMAAGDHIGKETIQSHLVSGEKGILTNQIRVKKSRCSRPSCHAQTAPAAASGIVTGTVTAVDGNRIQVKFDYSGGIGGGLTWIPYESVLSNSFYCMPDVGDKAFIYYENNGKIICMGSRRKDDSHPDYDKPKEKVMTNHDKMIKHTATGLNITATRALHDQSSNREISVKMDDEEGITITSGEEIRILADKNIRFAAGEKKPSEHNALQKQGKEQFTARDKAGAAEYAEDSGLAGSTAMFAAAKTSASSLGTDIKDSFVEGGKALVFYDIWGGKEKKTEEAEETVYETGVLSLYASEELVVSVGESVMELNENIIFSTPEFRWLGYEQKTHEKVEEELKDWWEVGLDGLQLVLDIAGFIPGIGDVLDLVNAGISLARGDYFGAASSLVSAIPGVGSFIGGGAKAAKAAAKGAKAVQKLSKAVTKATKIIRKAEEFYNGINIFASIYRNAGQMSEILKDIRDGKFDITNPKDAARALQMVSAASPLLKIGAAKTYKKVKQKKQKGGDNTSVPGNGGTDPKNKQTCALDPVNVVTGSQTLSYTDFALKDKTGIRYLKRTYESIYRNEGNLFGFCWMSEMDSSVAVQDNVYTVQMPDMHLIRFQKTEQGYENVMENKSDCRLFDSPEGYVLKDIQKGIFMYYGHNGKLTATEDRNHNRTRYLYENGVLQKIEYPGGQFLSFTLKEGKITEITDAIGRTLHYEYEGEFLTKATLANGGSIQYHYTPEGNIHSITDQNGRTYVTNHYDRSGRVVRQELSGGEEYVIFYDDREKQNTFVTTATGKRITYRYGKEKLPTLISYEDGTYEEKKYDRWHNVIYERDRNGGEIHRSYDAYGNLLEETLPNGLTTTFTYNEAGDMLTCIDNAGREEFYEYDSCGNPVKKSRRLDSKTMQTYRYGYDSAGRITSETDPEGNTTTYSYDTEFALYSTIKNAEGTEIRYTYDKAGRNMAVEHESGTFRYGYNAADFVTKEEDEEGNATRYDYDRMCNLIRRTEPNFKDSKNTADCLTRYEYDDMDCLIREISPMGRVKAFVNDSEGNITKEINPNFYDTAAKDGIGIQHTYDHDGNRIQTIYPDGARECFRYDAEGSMTDYIRPEAYEKEGEAAKGIHYIYDEVGRLTGIQNESGIMEKTFVYDLCGNIIKEVDAKGYELGETKEEKVGTLFTYNLAGWMLEKREPADISEAGGVSYRLTTYEYDKNGNLTKEKRFLEYQSETSRNGKIHVICYEYDKINRITRVTDTTGAELRYTYNSRNALTSLKEKMAEGKWRELHYFYRSNGRLERVAESADKEGTGKGYAQTGYEYDASGNLTKITTPSGNEILRTYDADNFLIKEEHREPGGDIENTFTYAYDKAGNLVKVTDVFGTPVTYEYDAKNRLISMTGKNGGITRVRYDKNDRIISEILPREWKEKGENARGYRYTYDNNDHITSLKGPDETLIYERTYNPYGELEQETDNKGCGIRFSYDYPGRRIHARTTGNAKESYQYDALGNLTALIDGNGNKTGFQVDAWGRIKEVIKADSSRETYEYDLAGNMTSATDGEHHQVKYSYNTAGTLSSRTDAGGNTEYFQYDIEGRLCRHKDRNGSETTYHYNMYHDLTRKEHKASGLQEVYSYRKDGSLSYAIGGGMRYDYTYYPDGSLHEKKASGKTLLSFAYDLNGNRIRQSDITGKSTNYTYNALDLLEEIRDNDFSARYHYHSNGTVKSLSVGDKLTTCYEYDSDKNLTRQWTKMKGEIGEEKRIRLGIPAATAEGNIKQTLLADYRYTYDGNGNRTGREGLNGKTSYQYDTLNRLVKVAYPKGLEEFTYDKADNRIRRLTEKTEELYQYDVCNRLIEKQTRKLGEGMAAGTAMISENISKPGDVKTMASQEAKIPEAKLPDTAAKQDNLIPFQISAFQYDNQGNLLREERKTEGNRQESIYSYDGFNRQKKIINFENKVQVNHYDGEGLRHEMEENGTLVKFLYADREAVVEEKEDGNILRFIRGYDLIASDSESARTYYHYACDEQGSITHVLGEDREEGYTVKNQYQYSAFGEYQEQYEEVENRFGYNGEIYDPVGGQYYLRARYYNPVIGRFTQEDTYYGDGLNLYAYCRNLPIGYEDPSGYAAHSICENKVAKLEEKEKTGTLTKEDYKELRRYRRAKDNEFYQQERQIDKSSRELYNEKKKADSSFKPMTWNEFQSVNKGKYTRSQMSDAWNKYKQANYPDAGKHYLHRPYIRQSTLEAVNRNTRTNSKGQIYDRIGRKWVDVDNIDLGHLPPHEFWYERNMAEMLGMTQAQFNEYMNNPDFYAWQDRHDNRSHALEDKH